MKFRLSIYSATIGVFALTAAFQLAAQDNQDHNKHHHYKLIDIATFGGPTSSVPELQQIVNGRGILVGQADTSIPDPYYPNCLNADCYVSHAFEWQTGILTDLGALPGGGSSTAGWITASGLAVGLSQNGEIDPLTGNPEQRAVLWENGIITDLGTFGGNQSAAIGANNRSQVIGVALNAVPDPFSFFGATQARAFMWEHGKMHDLGTLGGPDAFGQYINGRAQVSGFSYTSYTPNPSTGLPPVDPFLWEKGKGMQDLGSLGGTFGQVNDMNDRGQVVGTSNLAGDTSTHGFIWARGVLTDVGTFGGSNSEARSINDAGEVAGVADFPGDQISHGFLWKSNRLTDLGTVDSDPCSRAYSINSGGQIVGGSSDCSTILHAFLWEHGGPMTDLNTLIPPNSSLQLNIADFVNDRGEIAGVGVPAGCTPQNVEFCGHAFLLIPCDEDHPGIEDCDYSMVEASAPASVQPTVRATPGRTLPTTHWRRNKWFGFLGTRP